MPRKTDVFHYALPVDGERLPQRTRMRALVQTFANDGSSRLISEKKMQLTQIPGDPMFWRGRNGVVAFFDPARVGQIL